MPAVLLFAGAALLTELSAAAHHSVAVNFERGAPIEAEHVVGDLLRRGGKDTDASSLLRTAYLHLKAYEARRVREAGLAKAA